MRWSLVYYPVVQVSVWVVRETCGEELCVGDIRVLDGWRRVRWRTEAESAETAARRVIEKGGGNATEEAVAQIAVFLGHRRALSASIRREFRRAIRYEQKSGPAAIGFTGSWTCDEEMEGRPEGSALDRRGRWFLMDRNAWRPDSGSDWVDFVGDLKPDSIALRACDANISDGIQKFAVNAVKFLGPGGTIAIYGDVSDEPFLRAGLETASGPTHDMDPEIEAAEFRCPDTSTVKMYRKPGQPEATAVKSARVINLNRRPDRLASVSGRAHAAGFTDLERVEAVDGRELDLGTYLTETRIFDLDGFDESSTQRSNPHRDHGYRPSVLGCAASHVKAWRLVAAYHQEDPLSVHLVLEDDVFFARDFKERWNEVLWPFLLRDQTWDIVQLGVLDDRDLYGDRPVVVDGLIMPLKEFSSNPRTFGAGAFAYLIRPRTALTLLNALRTHPIQQPVDWWLVDRYRDLVAYKADPPLVASPQGDGRDSDNDELYDMRRLLLRERQAFDLDTARFEVTDPPPGAAFLVSDVSNIKLAGQLSVPTDPALFRLRHPLARLCVDAFFVESSGALSQTLAAYCLGIAKTADLPVPETAFPKPGWYHLDVSLKLDLRDSLAADALFIEIIPDPDAPRTLPPLPPAARLDPPLASLDVVVDSKPAVLQCPSDGPGLYNCVHTFCLDNSIQPLIDCLARLTASLAAKLHPGTFASVS